MAWLRLVRWSNLIIIFLTQLLAWYCVIRPAQNGSEHDHMLDLQHFLLLSLSTVLIAAAGYIINDYFDVRIDNINHPDKMILEKVIPRKQAIIVHSVLNFIALTIAAWLALRAGSLLYMSLQLLCTVLLWFYSTSFKRRFVTGNVVVSLLTALTIVTLLLYEPAMHHYLRLPSFLEQPTGTMLPNPVWVLAIYSFFAFTLTWMREIVKDMEDFKGDEAEGCVTMPIVWGLRKAEKFTQMLGILALIPLVVVGTSLLYKKDLVLGIYIFAALVLPLLVWLQFLTRTASPAHYGVASRWLKLIMVAGIGSLIVYYFEI